jgi:hypothetical protein
MDGKQWGFISLFVLVAVGCSQSSTPPTGGAASTAANKQPNSVDISSPDKAVFDFLEAVRTGNDKKAASMLTPLARQKTAEFEMVVAPPGSPTARFKVGGFKFQSDEKNSAFVESSWTDVIDDERHTRTDDIVWALRLEAEGWRIGGMVTKVFPDQPALILNFEDPQDMLRKQQLLQQGSNGQASDGQALPAQSANVPEAASRTEPGLPAAR